YIVEFAPGTVNGSVLLYDPMFCATGGNTANGRRLGAGDFWFGNGGTGITSVYNLWDMNGTPYTLADDTLLASSGGLFANSNAVDKGPLYRGDQNYGGGSNGSGSPDCQASPYHLNWWRLATGLSEGQYRLQVSTSSGSNAENAINGFGIEATALGGPTTGINACAPGSAASGGPTTTLVTSTASCNYYNNQWVTISVPIPATYTAPVSPGDPPGAGGGWWKIEYGTLGTGQDITTWEVNIRGNPVHLITP